MHNVPVEDVFIVSNRYSSAYSYSHGTYSSTHEWSFSAGPVESGSSGHVGPCNIQSGISAPSYVGNDYYCESGTLINPENIWYTSDPSGMAYLCCNRRTALVPQDLINLYHCHYHYKCLYG